MDRDLQIGLASIVSRLEALREELAAHTMALITRDAMRANVPEHDLPKVVADRYLHHVKKATELGRKRPKGEGHLGLGNINPIPERFRDPQGG